MSIARSTRLLCRLLVLVAPVAAACSGGLEGAAKLTTTSVAPTTALKPSNGPSSSATTTSTSDPNTTIGVTTTVASTTTSLATPAGDTGPSYFQLPSGNIGCYMDATAVRCDIRDRQWSPPARPADCPLDYGQGIVLSTGRATFVCAGDTALGGPDTLSYGSAARRGALVCNSTVAGVSCRNVTTGRGFSLARQGYDIF